MMTSTKKLSVFVLSFLICGSLFLAVPQTGLAGDGPIFIGCCQFDGIVGELETNIELPEIPGFFECSDNINPEECAIDGGEFFRGLECNRSTGRCEGSAPSKSVPTISEWGLIGTAAVLGFIGFIAIRRRKATA